MTEMKRAQAVKPEIIEALFKERFDSSRKVLKNPLITLSDISRAIREYNAKHPKDKPLSDRNPANFFKDFVRNRRRANANWPKSVFVAGYTARQITGENRCFEFVPAAPGAEVPFTPDLIPGPSDSTHRHDVETTSMPLASRRLGRSDEPWLVQVLVRQRVIEAHFAFESTRKVVQLDHLQMSVKLAKSEVDALFLAVEDIGGGKTQELIVSCEAKGRKDDILHDQIVAQVKAVARMKGVTQELILPLAVKAILPSEVYLIEFQAIRRDEAEDIEALTIASSAVYRLVPTVPGIGK